jgi:hypothetical protein
MKDAQEKKINRFTPEINIDSSIINSFSERQAAVFFIKLI